MADLTDDDLKLICEEIKRLTPEDLAERLYRLRQRQHMQQIAEPKPFTCDKCKLTIPSGNAVFDVAISYQTMPDNPSDLDWDPQYEEYLCTECALAVTGLPGWPPPTTGS